MEEPATRTLHQQGRTRLDLNRKPIQGEGRPELFSRVPAMRIQMKWDTCSRTERIDEVGALLLNPSFPPSAMTAALLRSRPLKEIAMPCLPEDAAVAFYGDIQRVSVKHFRNISGNEFLASRLLLDLTGSSRRDKFIFNRPSTQFLLVNNITGETCMLTLKLSIKDTALTTAAVATTPAAGQAEVEPQEDDDTTEATDTNAGLPSAPATLQVLFEDREVTVLDSDKVTSVLLGSRVNKDPEVPTIPLPIDTEGSWIAGLALDADSGFMITPRLQRSSTFQIFIVLPDNQEFHLMYGDRLFLEAGGKREAIQFQVEQPSLCRTLSSLNDHPAHPAQVMDAIALEVPVRAAMKKIDSSENNNGSEVKTVTTEYLLFTPKSDSFYIGRMSQDVFIADPHLSKYHAQISRVGGNHFQVAPHGDRPIFMLLGRREQHYRPPMPLRKGDVITAGKSEFKVVYQQRGEPGSFPDVPIEEELALRLKRHDSSCELRTKPGRDADVTNFSAAESAKSAASDNTSSTDIALLMTYFVGTALDPEMPLLLLVGVRGPALGKYFLCDPIETIVGTGRGASVRVPDDRRMSGYHCRIFFDSTQRRWVVQDLQSRHGTFLKISGGHSVILAVGDVLVMGQSTIRVLAQLGVAATSTPPERTAVPRPPPTPCCTIS